MIHLSFLLTILAQTQIGDPDRFNNYLVLAYAAIWGVAVIYLFYLANRQRNARKELQLLQQLLEEDKEHSAE